MYGERLELNRPKTQEDLVWAVYKAAHVLGKPLTETIHSMQGLPPVQ